MKRATVIAVLATCLMLVFAATSVAATPTQDTYSGVAGQQETSITPVAGESSGGSGGGALPFTGANLIIIAVAGVALVGTGIIVRRASRPPMA